MTDRIGRIAESWVTESEVAAHVAHRAGKLVRVRSYTRAGSHALDVEAIRKGTPKHIDVNERDNGGLNVWVPGVRQSSRDVKPFFRSTNLGYGKKFVGYVIGAPDGAPLERDPEGGLKMYSAQEAVDKAVAIANESRGGYSEEIHRSQGGPITGYDVTEAAKTRPAVPPSAPPLSQHGEFLKRWHGGQTGWPSDTGRGKHW